MDASIEEFKELAKKLYMLGDRKPLTLLGPPGIGKTEGIRQLAMELAEAMNLEFVEYDESLADEIMENRKNYFPFLEFRLYEADPADFIGIPRDVNGYVTYKPLRWAQVFATGAGLLSLDEITNIQRLDLQAIVYKIFERKVGFIKFHPEVMITATGNRPEDSVIATMLPAPLINRVRVFNIKAPNLDEWVDYMYRTRGEDWDKNVAAFIARFRRFFLEKPEDVETLNQYATPRAWTGLAEFSHKLGIEELELFANSSLGNKAGQHFIAFRRLDIPDVDEIVENPENWDKLDVDLRYLAILQMSSILAEDIRMNGCEKAVKKFENIILHLHTRDREFLTILMTLIPSKERVDFFMSLLKNPRLKPAVSSFTKLYYRVKKLKL
ncbi:MAG TPA: hypothetical protein EYP30_08750 [Archaeoglobaceae archaeon]|nr:hypothetical protein [Archaeoglobaceae archaeon]